MHDASTVYPIPDTTSGPPPTRTTSRFPTATVVGIGHWNRVVKRHNQALESGMGLPPPTPTQSLPYVHTHRYVRYIPIGMCDICVCIWRRLVVLKSQVFFKFATKKVKIFCFFYFCDFILVKTKQKNKNRKAKKPILIDQF